MRTRIHLGAANLALVSLYFAPVFGSDAVRALLSPYRGLEERLQGTATSYFGRLFDFGLECLTVTSGVLAAIKLVVAAGFLAYAIEFARALAVKREVDRSTLDLTLLLAAIAIVVWALPPLALQDPALIRVCATQLMLIAGAAVVIMVERQTEQAALAGERRSAKPAVPSQTATGVWASSVGA